MEVLYFILGMLSVVTLVAVVSVFRIKTELKEFTTNKINFASDDMLNRLDMLDRRIDQEIDRVDQMNHKLYDYADKLYQNHEDNLNELYKYVDSRTDKMADSTAKHIAEINKQIANA